MRRCLTPSGRPRRDMAAPRSRYYSTLEGRFASDWLAGGGRPAEEDSIYHRLYTSEEYDNGASENRGRKTALARSLPQSISSRVAGMKHIRRMPTPAIIMRQAQLAVK